MNKKLLLLATALTLGTAGAIGGTAGTSNPTPPTPPTAAGTIISNTAKATFTDPATNTKTDVTSNTVTTKVAEKMGFNVTYVDGGDTTSTSTLTGAKDPEYVTSAKVGTEVIFKYVAVNTGNKAQDIALTTETDGVDESTVTYYLDADDDGVLDASERNTPITSVADVPAGGNKGFFQVYTVPTGASGAIGATPVGKGLEYDPSTKQNKSVTEDANKLHLQYNKVNITKPNAAIGPDGNPDANGAADQQEKTVPNGTTKVLFTNTIKNTGNTEDTFTIESDEPGTVFKGPNGETLTSTPQTINGIEYSLDSNKNLVIGKVPAGESATFRNEVPYTDKQPDVASQDEVILTVTSKNDPSKTDTTTNIIKDQAAPLTGEVHVAKFVQGGTDTTPQHTITPNSGYGSGTNPDVVPGGDIVYQIIAKNDYNTAVDNFKVCDTVPANTTLKAVSGGQLYQVGGGSWTTTAPTGTAAGTEICVANGTSTPSALAAGATLTVDFTVTVK